MVQNLKRFPMLFSDGSLHGRHSPAPAPSWANTACGSPSVSLQDFYVSKKHLLHENKTSIITKALKNSTLWDRLQYLSTFISFGVSTSAPLTVIQIARWVLITPHWREQGSCKYALNWGYIFLPCTLCLSWGTNVGPWEQELGHIPGTLPLSVKYVLFTDVSYTIGSKLLIHMHKDIPKSKVQRRKKNYIYIFSEKWV